MWVAPWMLPSLSTGNGRFIHQPGSSFLIPHRVFNTKHKYAHLICDVVPYNTTKYHPKYFQFSLQHIMEYTTFISVGLDFELTYQVMILIYTGAK
jgi:hypothetical protein